MSEMQGGCTTKQLAVRTEILLALMKRYLVTFQKGMANIATHSPYTTGRSGHGTHSHNSSTEAQWVTEHA